MHVLELFVSGCCGVFTSFCRFEARSMCASQVQIGRNSGEMRQIPMHLEKSHQLENRSSSPYVSPRELASRWQCSRSSVDRIAERAGLSRLCLGEGRNGMVRYVREEVERYEESRRL